MNVQTHIQPGYGWIPPNYRPAGARINPEPEIDIKAAKQMMADAIKKRPRTALELRDMTGLGISTVRQWLTDQVYMGRVVNRGKTRDDRGHLTMTLWGAA